jgi:hypothetical protein
LKTFPWPEAVAAIGASDLEICGIMALKIYDVKILFLFGCHAPPGRSGK